MGVDGAVALWDKLIGGELLGNVAWEKDTLGTRFTWEVNRKQPRHYEPDYDYVLVPTEGSGYLQAALRVWIQRTSDEPS